MRLSTFIIIFLIICVIVLFLFLIFCIKTQHSPWNNNEKRSKMDLNDIKNKSQLDTRMDQCNDDKLVFQLSRFYIVSPERILVLLTNDNLHATCLDIRDALDKTNAILSMPADNLYKRLFNGLEYFYSSMCIQNKEYPTNDLLKYHSCIKELRNDFTECEGPEDWFERTNNANVCQLFNDISQCQYEKVAMLCTHKAAKMISTLSKEIMQKVILFKCKVTRSLPQVDEVMKSAAAAILSGRSFYL